MGLLAKAPNRKVARGQICGTKFPAGCWRDSFQHVTQFFIYLNQEPLLSWDQTTD